MPSITRVHGDYLMYLFTSGKVVARLARCRDGGKDTVLN